MFHSNCVLVWIIFNSEIYLKLVIAFEIFNINIPEIYIDIALKAIYFNAFLNPFFHGFCRGNYRVGFYYLIKLVGHHILRCLIKRPPGKVNTNYCYNNMLL